MINNKFVLRKARYEVMKWIYLTQKRHHEQVFANSVMDLRVSRKERNF
jgi:hypothetical protein